MLMDSRCYIMSVTFLNSHTCSKIFNEGSSYWRRYYWFKLGILLAKKGWDVTVLDKTDLSDSCSYGNLGMIVPSHFVPLAAPGMVAQGIRWMFNSKSPFYVKPSLKQGSYFMGIEIYKKCHCKKC